MVTFELLLDAERALVAGLLDRAERTYRQVLAAEPHNAIAIVGLARIALERGDETAALNLARQALAADPENVAAQRLVARLEEVRTAREAAGEGADERRAAGVPTTGTRPLVDSDAVASGEGEAEATSGDARGSALSGGGQPSAGPTPTEAVAEGGDAARRPASDRPRGWLDRLLRRRR